MRPWVFRPRMGPRTAHALDVPRRRARPSDNAPREPAIALSALRSPGSSTRRRAAPSRRISPAASLPSPAEPRRSPRATGRADALGRLLPRRRRPQPLAPEELPLPFDERPPTPAETLRRRTVRSRRWPPRYPPSHSAPLHSVVVARPTRSSRRRRTKRRREARRS